MDVIRLSDNFVNLIVRMLFYSFFFAKKIGTQIAVSF